MQADENPITGATSWSRLLGVLAIVPALLAAHPLASAERENPSGGTIVALASGGGPDALLKSDGKTLFKSGDEGKTWDVIPLPGTAEGTIAAIATPKDGKDIVYVGGPGLGLLRSEDQGASWTALDGGLPSRDVMAIAAHATQPETLYAYVPESGIYRSQDAGKSWRLMDKGPEGMGQLIHTNMAGSMESGWLYAATKQGIQLSMDCFCFWRDAGELAGAIRAIGFDPQKPEVVYAASGQDFFRSDNGGQAWQPVASPGRPVTALVVAPSGTIFAATDDGELHRSSDQGATWVTVGD